MCKLNAIQQIIAAAYAGGEFAGINTVEDAENCGDTLFLFLLQETDEQEDCDSIEEGIRRLAQATKDIESCLREATSAADHMRSGAC